MRKYIWKQNIGGSKEGARDVCPPGSKFFHFYAVFGKKLQNNANLGVGVPPSAKSWIRHWRLLKMEKVKNAKPSRPSRWSETLLPFDLGNLWSAKERWNRHYLLWKLERKIHFSCKLCHINCFLTVKNWFSDFYDKRFRQFWKITVGPKALILQMNLFNL